MINTLKIKEIIPDKNQPRKYFQVEKMASLKDSIKKHGIISPLTVQKTSGGYLLIDGERRFRAAQEIGLMSVPVNIVAAKGDFDRLVEQFHIQEQHAEWTSTEKALAILDICDIAKKSLKEVCEMLSIDERQARSYTAFAKLQNKERFVNAQVSISNAEKINELKIFTKKLSEDVLGEPFTKAEEGKIEKILVEKLSNKEITDKSDYSRIKDSFRSNPKLVKEFMSGDYDISRQFIKSNAKGARAARNMIINFNYGVGNAGVFLADPSVKLTTVDIGILKRAQKAVNDVLKLVD